MENLISFHVEHHHFRAATDAGFDPAVNDAIHYRFAQDKLHFFDKRTEENLLGNAWKYSRNEKIARIRFGKEQ